MIIILCHPTYNYHKTVWQIWKYDKIYSVIFSWSYSHFHEYKILLNGSCNQRDMVMILLYFPPVNEHSYRTWRKNSPTIYLSKMIYFQFANCQFTWGHPIICQTKIQYISLYIQHISLYIPIYPAYIPIYPYKSSIYPYISLYILYIPVYPAYIPIYSYISLYIPIYPIYLNILYVYGISKRIPIISLYICPINPHAIDECRSSQGGCRGEGLDARGHARLLGAWGEVSGWVTYGGF